MNHCFSKIVILLCSTLLISACGKFGFLKFNKNRDSVRAAANLPPLFDLDGDLQVIAGSCASFSFLALNNNRERINAPRKIKYQIEVIPLSGKRPEPAIYTDSSCTSKRQNPEILEGAAGDVLYFKYDEREQVRLRFTSEGASLGDWTIEVLPSGPRAYGINGVSREAVAGDCVKMWVEVQDALGNPTPALNSKTINLVGDTFFQNSTCLNSITSVIVSKDTSRKIVYFKSTKAKLHGLRAEGDLRTNVFPLRVKGGIPAQLTVVGPSQLAAKQCSAAYRVYRRDAFGNESEIDGQTEVTLSGLSAGAILSSQGGCFSESRITNAKLKISPNTSFAKFFISNPDSEVFTIDANSKNLAKGTKIVRTVPSGKLADEFGSAGRVVTNLGGEASGSLRASTVQNLDQNAGKIVVAGVRQQGTAWDLMVIRYLTTGAVDTSFGSNGMRFTDVANGSIDLAFGVAVDGLDRIIVVGSTGTGSSRRVVVVRYTVDGSPDTSFGTNGITVTDVGSGPDQALGVAIDSQNRVVVAGFTNSGSGHNTLVLRYTTTGVLDVNFGTGGVLVSAVSTSDDIASAVAVDALDGVWLGGYAKSGSDLDSTILHVSENGVLVASRTRDLALSGQPDAIESIAVQPAVGTEPEKILFGGYVKSNSINHSLVGRINRDLSLDTEFGTLVSAPSLRTGFRIVKFGETRNSAVHSIVVLPNRAEASEYHVVAGGYASGDDTGNDFALLKFSNVGELDPSFASFGKYSSAVSGFADELLSISIVLPQQKILGVGYTADNSGSFDMLLSVFD